MATNKKNPLANERGVTLVELLATLAISSIALTLIWNIFLAGTQANVRVEHTVRSQQDATILTQSIRSHHVSPDPYSLQVNADSVLLDGNDIASGNQYTAAIDYGGIRYGTGDVIDVTTKTPITLHIVITGKTGKTHDIRTTIQKEGD